MGELGVLPLFDDGACDFVEPGIGSAKPGIDLLDELFMGELGVLPLLDDARR